MNTICIVWCILALAFIWPHQILGQEEGQDLELMMSADRNAQIGEKLITKVCDHAIYKNLCLSSLQSVPESKNADLFELAEISLKVTAENATAIKNHVEKLLHSTSDSDSDNSSHRDLADCLENYQDALERINDSLKALENKGYNDVNSWVTAAMADAESCEEGFRDHPDHKSPLTAKNTVFSQLCSTALTITNLLSVGV